MPPRRCDDPLELLPHEGRDAGQHHHPGDDQGGKLWVTEELRPLGQVGHAERHLRESGTAVVARVHLAQDPLHPGMAPQRDAQRPRDRREGQVVMGGPHSTAGEDPSGPPPGREQRLDHGVGAVRDDVHGGELDAQLVQAAGQVGTVLVLHLGRQHLAAHDHHGGRGVHGHGRTFSTARATSAVTRSTGCSPSRSATRSPEATREARARP